MSRTYKITSSPNWDTNKYKPEYCNEAVDFLGDGGSIVELAKHLRVSRNTLYLWAKEHEKFAEALEVGKDYSQAHWENKLKFLMVGMNEDREEVNVIAPLVKFYLTNRFGWSDKTETKNENSNTEIKPIEISDEQYARVKAQLADEY